MPKLTALQRHAKSAADLSHVFTEGEIQGMRKALHQADRDIRDAANPHWATKEKTDKAIAAGDQRDALFAALDDHEYRITPEHTAKGLAWFESMHNPNQPYTPDGGTRVYLAWRDNETTRCFPVWCREIIDNFDHFTFCGFEDVGNGHVSFYVPVYGVYPPHVGGCSPQAAKRDSFRYCYGSWQAGSRVMVNP